MNGPSGRVTAVATTAALLVSATGGATRAHDAPAPNTPAPRTPAPRSPAPGTPAPAPLTPVPRGGPPAAGPGAAGLGDRYYPGAGNGGYDVAHYDIALAYAGRRTGKVDATVTINAMATAHLSRFNLDYRGPAIRSVMVDGRPAAYRRKGQELKITPGAALPAGRPFVTTVRYAGRPRPIRNKSLGTYGWVPTRDGAVVMAQPNGAPTWLPVNDHPRDKATYSFHVKVPKGLKVLANGRQVRTVRQEASTTYEWAEDAPMASYLAMVAIGRFRVRHGHAGHIPVTTAVDPKFARAGKNLHATTIKALTWASKVFGRYPFGSAGGIVDDPRLDYALESQERPVYAGFVPDEGFIVHELAHQWFGDSVTPRTWADLWLSEGFATYAEWLWRERGKTGTGHRDTAAKIFKRHIGQPAGSPIFKPPPGRPSRHDLFGFSVYIRGAMCLHALRERVGDKAFFRILRTWASSHRHANATTPEFVAHAERESGRRLDRLFHVWLYKKGKPRKW